MLKIRYNAPVVLTFAIVSLLTLPLNWLTAGWTTPHLFTVYRCSLLDVLAYVRFFGHVLGHSNWAHYMNNMLLMLLVGPPLEEKYGSRSLLLFIAATALATGLAQFIFFPGKGLLGASGVVFMMIVLSSFTGVSRGAIPLTTILVAALYLGQEVFAGLRGEDGISQLTHIIGGVCGMIVGFTASTQRRTRR